MGGDGVGGVGGLVMYGDEFLAVLWDSFLAMWAL